jgi:hypothetical protein
MRVDSSSYVFVRAEALTSNDARPEGPASNAGAWRAALQGCRFRQA